MGGFGSGRKNGRPVIDDSKVIDLALMLRRGWVKDGSRASSQSLTWTCKGGTSESICYDYDLLDPDRASMSLRFCVTHLGSGTRTDHVQQIRLSYTPQRLGGRRWWMHCPITGERVGKLYVPPGGDIFACRKAWRLGYKSQRLPKWEQSLEALFRIQTKLGAQRSIDAVLCRPKGMWKSTYDRHLERHLELKERFTLETMRFSERLGDQTCAEDIWD